MKQVPNSSIKHFSGDIFLSLEKECKNVKGDKVDREEKHCKYFRDVVWQLGKYNKE